jgi:D-sedoheptulose 7-phosphate isomerase
MQEQIKRHFQAHIELSHQVQEHLGSVIAQAGEKLIACLEDGGTIFLCGNGGSAADAQHIAAELTGRYLRPDRKPLQALSLTTDTSALTAIGNDFGFDQIFARQLRALAVGGDVLIGISTSGNSRNVLEAFRAARELGVGRILLAGGNGGALKPESDLAIVIPHTKTPHIQEMHITIGHILCEIIDSHFDSQP